MNYILTILGECLFVSGLPDNALRMLVELRISKPSLVNLISNDVNLVFYLSVNTLVHSSY